MAGPPSRPVCARGRDVKESKRRCPHESECFHPRLRGDRVEAAGVNVSPGSVAALGQSQEPECPAVKRKAEEDWGPERG